MLAREGELDRLSSLVVSLGASLTSPRMNDLARRLYAVLGRLPAGWARENAGQLLPGDIDDAPVRLLRTRLVRFEDGRLRMLGPIREHALAQQLADGDEAHLAELLTGLADALPLQHETAADPARAAQARREIANIEAALGEIRAAGTWRRATSLAGDGCRSATRGWSRASWRAPCRPIRRPSSNSAAASRPSRISRAGAAASPRRVCGSATCGATWAS